MQTNNYKKWSDAKFKKIFLIFLIISVVPTMLLISLVRPLEDKYQSLMQSKKVYILDKSGQRFVVSAQDTREKTFQIFGSMILKSMFTITHNENTDNLDFVKQYSSEKLYKKLLSDTSSIRTEVYEVSGGYTVSINKYYVYRDGERYVMEVFFDHNLVSKAVSDTKKYLLRMYLASGSNTTENFSGIFLDDYEIFSGTELEDEIEKITEDLDKDK